jgi:hypothetical protein
MKRFSIDANALMLAPAMASADAVQRAPRKPNIVLLLADDQAKELEALWQRWSAQLAKPLWGAGGLAQQEE